MVMMAKDRSDCFLPPSLSHDGVVLAGECRSRIYESTVEYRYTLTLTKVDLVT